MLFGADSIDTDAAKRVAEQDRQQQIYNELAWREQELARWSIILTVAVGSAAALAAGYHIYRATRGKRVGAGT